MTDRRRIIIAFYSAKIQPCKLVFLILIKSVHIETALIINRVLFYLLIVKMTGTLKSVARQQMTMKLNAQLIAQLLYKYMQGTILSGISQIASDQLDMSRTIVRNFEN